MKFKLALASFGVLGILSGFLASIIFIAMYLTGNISVILLFSLTILFNLIMFFVYPLISDWMYRWIYKIHFYSLEELEDRSYIKKFKVLCDKHKVKYPKFGIIDDLNPTAFTYGSTKNNARIVFTKGLDEFLTDDEILAVLAHELGHVVHRDFIVMTIASTIIQLLYESYVVFRSMSFRRDSSSDKENSKILWVALAAISFVFYFIGTYIVLFLSRIREYYADEFSAEQTKDPNLLSNALIKIAYGIISVPDSKETARLLNSTRTLGIYDIKSNNSAFLSFRGEKDKNNLFKSLAFDFVNPWASLFELSSTHPLVGKRIRRLFNLKLGGYGSNFNNVFDSILKDMKIDYFKLWGSFFRDLFVVSLPKLLFLLILVFTFLKKVNVVIMSTFYLAYIFSVIFYMFYKFPNKLTKSTTLELMGDLYASPIRGRLVELSGEVIGRGSPGNRFSEDMMFKDSKGIIYLNYESFFGFFGNLFFAMKKFTQFLGVKSIMTGWFFRSSTHHIELLNIKSGQLEVNSSVRFWFFVKSIFAVILVGVLVYFNFFV